MKRLRHSKAAVFLLMVVFAGSPAGLAQEMNGEYAWGDKLTRGVVNFFTSPVEIPRTINFTSQEKGPATGWTAGLVRGLGRMLLRAGAGVVEVVTFPFDWPEEDKSPLIEPKYAWQDWENTRV